MSIEILKAHLHEHAIRRGDFVLKSGVRSEWFIDGKQTACRPEGIVAVADAILDFLPDDVTAIGGLTMGADPVAFGVAAVAAVRGRPLRSFSVRKEAKGHGGGGRIAGALEPDDRVLLVEDVVSRGTSLLEAAAAVAEFGASISLMTAIVDRGGTVTEMVRREGYSFRAVLRAPDLGLPWEGGLEGIEPGS